MTTKEEATLRALYKQWPTDQLARSATLEQKDYQPEAVALMLEELKSRSVTAENLPDVVASLPPPPAPLPERDTLLLPARLNRKQYFVRWVLWLFLVIGISVFLECGPWPQPSIFMGILAVGLIYKVFGLDIPRFKNARLSPWLLLLLLVPIANLVIVILLFSAPPHE